MSDTSPHTSPVVQFAAILEALDVSPDVLVEATDVPDPRSFAGLEGLSAVVQLDAAEDSKDTWRSALEERIPTDWRTVLVNGFGSDRSFEATVDGRLQRGAAALLYLLLDTATPGNFAVAITPAALWTMRTTASFREWIWANHQPIWLTTFRNRQSIPSIHPALELAIVVVRAGPAAQDSTRILRLVDLDDPDPNAWLAEIRRARQREGGEAGHSIVLRDPQLGGEAWTYQRFSRAFGRVIDDLRELGDMVKLGDLIAESMLGLAPQEVKRLQVEPDLFTEMDGGIRCFTGRSTLGGTLSGPEVWLNGDISSDFHLRAGDILLRRIVGPKKRQFANLGAVVRASDLPAVSDSTLIRLRPKPEVSSTTVEILASFINSEQFAEILVAAGQGLSFSAASIAELQVPMPSTEVLSAFDRLGQWEREYTQWAHECRVTRASVLSAPSYKRAVAALLNEERIHYERTTAAAASETFEYRVRNYFPYPIALRRELLRQQAPGKPRIKSTLDCAEHAINLLAFASMVQMQPDVMMDSPLPGALRSSIRNGMLTLDWGTAESVVREGLDFARGAKDILTLPFPELASIQDSAADSFFIAGKWLRDLRNALSHLEERPPVRDRTAVCGSRCAAQCSAPGIRDANSHSTSCSRRLPP